MPGKISAFLNLNPSKMQAAKIVMPGTVNNKTGTPLALFFPLNSINTPKTINRIDNTSCSITKLIFLICLIIAYQAKKLNLSVKKYPCSNHSSLDSINSAINNIYPLFF